MNEVEEQQQQPNLGMLRSCVCMQSGSDERQPKATTSTSDTDDATTQPSCSETCDNKASSSNATRTTRRTLGGAGSLFQILHSKGWFRYWNKNHHLTSMAKAEKTIKAAVLIQRWYRRYRARLEIRRRYTWRIFTSLEYAAENDQTELYSFYNALLTYMPTSTEPRGSADPQDYRASSDLNLSDFDLSDKNERVRDVNYMGPHIIFPIGRRDVDSLIDCFRSKKNNSLHVKYVAQILREAARRLRKLPNINKASTAVSKQITIIGDLHGKLDDLLVCFHKNGLPSTSNPYVFNGDFVDRGKKSIEVFLLLLVSFITFTGAVFLNRGNHEDSVMNGRYGFIREVQQKYKKHSDILLLLIDEVYRWLPLGTIINNKVLVVHGGISDKTDLDILHAIDRGRYVSILRPSTEVTGGDAIDQEEWRQLFDITWSDPQTVNGCEPNTTRGAGTYFGPDITEAFLKRNDLKLLVRSHECKPDGYEFTHNNKVITIFSASNYYAIGSNKGAYLKLNPALDPYFVQYVSAASKAREFTFREKMGIIEGSALRELGIYLCDHKKELQQEFQKYDPKRTGLINIQEWCDSLESVTNLGLPWRMMRDKLAPMAANESPNKVDYNTTLELLETDVLVKAYENTVSVTDSLYKNRANLEAIFHILDKDQSGYISLDEFADAIDILQKYLPSAGTREELMRICKMMDINKDGIVDLNEFLEAFRLCDRERKNHMKVKIVTPRHGSVQVNRVAATLKPGPEMQNDTIDPADHIARSSRK